MTANNDTPTAPIGDFIRRFARADSGSLDLTATPAPVANPVPAPNRGADMGVDKRLGRAPFA